MHKNDKSKPVFTAEMSHEVVYMVFLRVITIGSLFLAHSPCFGGVGIPMLLQMGPIFLYIHHVVQCIGYSMYIHS